MSTNEGAPAAKRKRPAGASGSTSKSKKAKATTTRRRWADGFASTTNGVYPPSAPNAELWTRKLAYPVSSIEASNTINFTIKAAKDEFIRFCDDPFLFVVQLKTTNPTHVPNAAGWQGMTEYLIQPKERNPGVFINPLLSGGSFIAKVATTLDGVCLTELEGTDDQGYFYTALNRIFTSDAIRNEKYSGERMEWISNTGQRQYTPEVVEQRDNAVPPVVIQERVAPQMSEELNRIMENVTADSRETSIPLVFRGGIDGLFPYSTQNNALRSLTRIRNDNPALPPFSVVDIAMTLRSPLESLIEFVSLTDAQYLAGQAIGAGDTRGDVKVEIKSVIVQFESFYMSNPTEVSQLSRFPLYYLHDMPFYREVRLKSNTTDDSVTIHLPRKVQLCYLVFLTDAQRQPGAYQRSRQACRFTFPRNLKELTISTLGKEGLINKTCGLRDLGTPEGASSVSLMVYHSDLVRKGLYTKPFSTWFPPYRPGKEYIGYDQAIILDMSPYASDQMTHLNVNLKYSADSPERLVLRCYGVSQYVFEHKSRNEWSSRPI